jgi:hypothetical protein
MKHTINMLLMAASLLLSACVHEHPEPVIEAPAKLSITYKSISMPLFMEMSTYLSKDLDGNLSGGLPSVDDTSTGDESRSALNLTEFSDDDMQLIRYTVNFYDADALNDPNSELYRVPIRTITLYSMLNDDGTPDDYTASVEIPNGKYTVIVWADYVSQLNPEGDMFYNATDFSEIRLTSNTVHRANTTHREAYFATEDVDLTDPDTEEVELNMDMEIPMARYQFIASDLEEFLVYARSRAEARAASKAADDSQSADSKAGDSKAGDKAPDDSRSIVSLDDYTIVVHYTSFMPCSFNLFTNKPADSWTGISYTGKVNKVTDTDALLAFDYVFVNHAETSISAYLELYDNEGELISRTENVEIPIVRGHYTTITGKFLTSLAQGGIGISTEYNGEFNMKIN